MSRRVEDYGGVRLHLPADADDARIEQWNDEVEARRRRLAAAYFSRQQDNPERSADDGISVKAAAEERGLSEDEMRSRLLGRAKLGVSADGRLLVRRGDLDALADQGVIPSRSTVERSERMARAIGSEDRKRSAPVDARTAAAADAIGVPVGGKRDRTDVDDRTDQIAAAIGLDLPERK